ncbi:MAG: diacylglycerol kinase family protein [Dehalococcoidia bacterium]
MRCVLIVNPASGTAREADLPEVLAIFEETGWTIDLVRTAGPGDATRVAAEAVDAGFDLVLVCGGDGTVNEALQALVGSRTALGVLPAGTANLLAREMQLPLRAPAAARALVSGGMCEVDVGLAGGRRYFLLFAGIGFDAAVIHAVDSEWKRRVGPLSYVAASAQVVPNFHGARAEIRLDGRRRRRHVLMAVVANTRLFALFPLTPRARANDGKLDVVVFHGVGFWTKVGHILAVLLGQHHDSPNVDQDLASQIDVRGPKPLPVELDGEPWGHTPMSFSVVPRSLRVWVPPNAPIDLFGGRLSERRDNDPLALA